MSVRGGILIGGQSSRMGEPKHLLQWKGATFAEHLTQSLRSHVEDVTFLGDGVLPQSLAHCRHLKDGPGLKGPMAGLLTALRADPGPWLIVACDLPLLSSSAIGWLLDQRRSGINIIMPRDSKGIVQPHFSFFERGAADLVEREVARGVRAPRELAKTTSFYSPSLPEEIEAELKNVNVPSDLETLGSLQ